MQTKELLRATGGKLIRGDINKTHKNISINSRTLSPGDVFIAIKGWKFDGHDFIREAIKNGASCIIISRSQILDPRPCLPAGRSQHGINIIYVKDTLKALQNIAAYHRNKFNIPIIGITGSSGKTTTKDMLASILSQELKTLKNEQNFNNEVGVPLTLLKLNKSHQVAVIEMAMQGLGELKLLAKIVKPSIVIITNIGEAHLGHLKTKRNIAKAKSEISTYLKKKDMAILPADDRHLNFLRKKIPNGAQISLFGEKDIEKYKSILKYIPLPGQHNVLNALAAIAAAKALRIKDSSIIKGLEKFKPSSKRMDIIKTKNKITIINDTYNANPSSMKAALSTLAAYPGGRKIAVLGDMLELGQKSKFFHNAIGNYAKEMGIDVLISVGKLSRDIKADFHYKTTAQAAKKLMAIAKPGDTMLVKGSRGMHMEKIVESYLSFC